MTIMCMYEPSLKQKIILMEVEMHDGSRRKKKLKHKSHQF